MAKKAAAKKTDAAPAEIYEGLSAGLYVHREPNDVLSLSVQLSGPLAHAFAQFLLSAGVSTSDRPANPVAFNPATPPDGAPPEGSQAPPPAAQPSRAAEGGVATSRGREVDSDSVRFSVNDAVRLTLDGQRRLGKIVEIAGDGRAVVVDYDDPTRRLTTIGLQHLELVRLEDLPPRRPSTPSEDARDRDRDRGSRDRAPAAGDSGRSLESILDRTGFEEYEDLTRNRLPSDVRDRQLLKEWPLSFPDGVKFIQEIVVRARDGAMRPEFDAYFSDASGKTFDAVGFDRKAPRIYGEFSAKIDGHTYTVRIVDPRGGMPER